MRTLCKSHQAISTRKSRPRESALFFFFFSKSLPRLLLRGTSFCQESQVKSKIKKICSTMQGREYRMVMILFHESAFKVQYLFFYSVCICFPVLLSGRDKRCCHVFTQDACNTNSKLSVSTCASWIFYIPVTSSRFL